ncbi:MAG: hypothetical protein B6245_06320 [Desulfobacteraceae bacterium 4572_88]|nr:MAG: hypothetical protein B6245_06320 [Desulfobacteraceae bacterium 4572_88]
MNTEKEDQKNKSEASRKKEAREAISHETPGLSGMFADLTDVMDIAMWELDLDYRVIAFNQKAKQVYGEDAKGDFCYAIAAKRTMLCPNCPARKVYEGHDSGRSEHYRTDASGNEIYIDHIATPIRDKDGNVTGSLVLIIDITEHKQMAEEIRQHRDQLEELVAARTGALRDSQSRYRNLYKKSREAEAVYHSLLNSSADPIVIYNLDGTPRYISPAFTELFGWTFKEVRGRRIPFVRDSEKEATMAIIRDVVDHGMLCQGYETKRLTKDGKLIDVSISASRFEDHKGKPAGLLVILRDISEKKKFEDHLRMIQRLESIGTLSGGIAHDFNNIMMGIMGNVSMMMYNMEESNPHFAKLKDIEQLIESGSKLTKQLLGYARKGKYEIRTRDLRQIIANTTETFGRTRKEIAIHLNLCEDPLPSQVDNSQIEQVLFNLYINSADAMPQSGDLYIDTRIICHDEITDKPFTPASDKYVVMQIRDTGMGMDSETQKRIFEPFFTTKEMGRGTGLGLASVYGIIKSHHGYIEVISAVGKGSSFYIYLPLSEKCSDFSVESTSEIRKGSGSVLLVDDEDIVLDVGAEMIAEMGYDVISADSGAKAIALYGEKHERIDLVVLDLIMPGKSGSETYDELRKINPDAKVLLSSGYSIDSETSEILKKDCNGFIQKPYNMERLSQKITEILGKPCTLF